VGMSQNQSAHFIISKLSFIIWATTTNETKVSTKCLKFSMGIMIIVVRDEGSLRKGE